MHPKVLVIGGSLSGLTFALACASRGVFTQVVERAPGPYQHGSALGVDRFLLLRATGCNRDNAIPFPAMTEDRQAVSWRALYSWLHAQAIQRPEIALTAGCTVSKVGQSASGVAMVTSRGEKLVASIVVGADGCGSTVRSVISPDHPSARYAGYLLWRGLISEENLPPIAWAPESNRGIALANVTGYRLVAYPVAGINGSLKPGERWISFAWYDKAHNPLLQAARCITSDGHVIAALAGENIPDQLLEELCGLARRLWPEPWSTTIIHALKRRRVFTTPVAEYFPERLCRERLAIIGDAAHAVSPAMGQGFVAGIMDAEALAECLADHAKADDGFVAALRAYEARRLPSAQELVSRSREWSRSFLHGTGNP